MDKTEVLIRIGLKNQSELESILGFKVDYDENHTIFKIQDDVAKSRLIGSKSHGWRVNLQSDTESEDDEPNLDLSLSLPNVEKIKINGQNFFHRGHILAKEFYKFIANKEEAAIKIKDNEKNGFIQFSVANMQQEKADIINFRHSQAFYENAVATHIRDTKCPVVYEVKVFFYNKDDKIPIGTQILFKTVTINGSKNPLEKNVFNNVFIPNFDEDFDLSELPEYLGSETYRKFYREGYDKKYEVCLKNIATIIKNIRISKTLNQFGEQIFYVVSKKDKSAHGIFFSIDDASKAFWQDAEEMLVKHFNRVELDDYLKTKSYSGKYFPARNEKRNISGVFFAWKTVESLLGFAMRGLKKQDTLEKAFAVLE